MKLNDQILLLQKDNKHKVIVLSGYINDDEDKLIAHDLLGNEFLVDWDLASFGQKNQRFQYWYQKTQLKLLMLEQEILEKFDLKIYQDITLELLQKVENYLNSNSHEQAL